MVLGGDKEQEVVLMNDDQTVVINGKLWTRSHSNQWPWSCQDGESFRSDVGMLELAILEIERLQEIIADAAALLRLVDRTEAMMTGRSARGDET